MNGNIKLRMKSAWQFNSANHTWWLCSPFSTDLTCFISLLVAVLTHPEYYISNIVPSVMTWHQPYQTIPCGKTLFNYIYSFCDNYRWGGGRNGQNQPIYYQVLCTCLSSPLWMYRPALPIYKRHALLMLPMACFR